MFPVLCSLAVLWAMGWGVYICKDAAECMDWQNDLSVGFYGILLAIVITMEGFCLLALAMFWSMW